MNLHAFHTRKQAEAGAILQLPDPRTGKDSGEWFKVVGIDSTTAHKAKAALRSWMKEHPAKTEAETEERDEEARLRLIASYVVEWSFDLPLTVDTLVELFREAPQLADLVDMKVYDRTAFFAESSKP